MGMRSRIEKVIYGGIHEGPGWLRCSLAGLSVLYGLGVELRKLAYAGGWLKAVRLDCVVVSVGNLTLGGTGKTPMTLYLARLIEACGFRVAVVSRGYKGNAGVHGAVVSDGRKILMEASASGDEAFMMARALKDVPVIVGRDRYAAGMRALEKFAPQVILLDDGFQHMRLSRDIDLVLLDAEKPFGNGRLIPRGTLREDKKALSRSSAMVLTRVEKRDAKAYASVARHAPGIPVFRCRHHPYVSDVILSEAGENEPPGGALKGCGDMELLQGKRGYLFSGIAQNERFHRTIAANGCQIRGTAGFADHHDYSSDELTTIMQSAVNSGADFIITTDKDFSRIPSGVRWPMSLVVVGVEIQFPDDAFDQYIREKLRQAVQ